MAISRSQLTRVVLGYELLQIGELGERGFPPSVSVASVDEIVNVLGL